jgi:hypothetical protein
MLAGALAYDRGCATCAQVDAQLEAQIASVEAQLRAERDALQALEEQRRK